jgi:hypothetical protein
MDLHPDDYEDPEENEWRLPSLADASRLPDNTKCWGPLFLWRGTPNPRQLLVSIAITREITPPWRRGLGITLKRVGVAFGVWLAGPQPRILSQPPAEEDWRKVVARANELERGFRAVHVDDP